MPPKRGRSKFDDDDKSGPSKVQLRGLSWNESAAKPAFLQNALAALQGPRDATRPAESNSGRPAIPERPGGAASGDDEHREESDEDEWDLTRGEEAPAVVVLKEGKHIDRDEVDRIRREAKEAGSSADPFASTSKVDGPAKSTGSLNFSSSTSKASRAKATEAGTESWDEVIQRSKADKAAKALLKEQNEAEAAQAKEKEKKRKAKEKKTNAKKIGMLSFADE